MLRKNPKKSELFYMCKKCDYKCCNNSDWSKHIKTDKHNAQKCSKMLIENPIYRCECNKCYKHIQSYNRHKKLCNYNENNNENNNKIIETDGEKIDYKEMFFSVIKQNKELQKTISELIPKIGNNNNNNNSNNNNINQKFNINVFLNEQCKDALTMEEFINKIEVSLSNLMLTKNKGINEGISNIFIENMNKLSLYERPIHCTDAKRETMYIKSEGINGESPKWEKDENNVKVRSAIKRVTHLQHKNINTWIDNHPDWEDKSDLQDEYLQIVKKCTDDINETKVIKRICDACVCNDIA